MVKNTGGGNKGKKVARKYQSGGNSGGVRQAREDGEIYAIVTKIYGQRCDVRCIDGINRIMIIRNKFKGRNARDNRISNNSWVLVGLRLWEVKHSDAKETCDLLEVYKPSDVDYLKSSVDIDWKPLTSASSNPVDKEDGADIEMVDENTQNLYDMLDAAHADCGTAESLDWLKDDDDDEELNIDDL